MNSETLLSVLGLLGLSGVVGTVVSRYVRPKLTPAEELQQIREDRAEDRSEIDKLRGRFNRLTDYVHELRQHIAEEKGPPPPSWPEGIDQ